MKSWSRTEFTVRHYWLLVLLAALTLPRLARLVVGVHVPDAAVGVFFAAGATAVGARGLAPCLLGVLCFDLAAFFAGVGGSCFTAGYPLRHFAFVVAWGLGRWGLPRSWMQQAGALALGSLSSFVLTSGGYYLLSGKFPNPTALEFGERAISFFPARLLAALAYWVVLVTLFRRLTASAPSSLRESLAGERAL